MTGPNCLSCIGETRAACEEAMSAEVSTIRWAQSYDTEDLDLAQFLEVTGDQTGADVLRSASLHDNSDLVQYRQGQLTLSLRALGCDFTQDQITNKLTASLAGE